MLQVRGADVARPTRARLAMEIGSYFRDSGDHRRAQAFIDLARYTLGGEPRSTSIRVLNARLHQHEAINKIVAGDMAGAAKSLKEFESEITAQYSIGHANQTLYEVHLLLKNDRPDFDLIGSLLKQYPSNSDPSRLTAWTDLELRLTEAQAEYQRSDKKSKDRAFARVRSALEQVRKLRIIPTQAVFAPVLGRFADEYSEHLVEIQGLTRSLPPQFVSDADVIRGNLTELANTPHRVA